MRNSCQLNLTSDPAISTTSLQPATDPVFPHCQLSLTQNQINRFFLHRFSFCVWVLSPTVTQDSSDIFRCQFRNFSNLTGESFYLFIFFKHRYCTRLLSQWTARIKEDIPIQWQRASLFRDIGLPSSPIQNPVIMWLVSHFPDEGLASPHSIPGWEKNGLWFIGHFIKPITIVLGGAKRPTEPRCLCKIASGRNLF